MSLLEAVYERVSKLGHNSIKHNKLQTKVLIIIKDYYQGIIKYLSAVVAGNTNKTYNRK